MGGISRKHLTGNNKVITSIARYYIYYHMKRFMEDSRKMNMYITSDIKSSSRPTYRLKPRGLSSLYAHVKTSVCGINNILTSTTLAITNTE